MKPDILTNFINYLVNKLIIRKLVNPADAAIYAFGIRTIIIQALHLQLVIILSLLAGVFWENMLFLAAFLILRVNAGGYHAPTNLLCYLITFITDLIILLLILYFPAAQYIWITAASALAAAAVLFKLAPVENDQKLLDTVEMAVYYRRTIIITLILLSLIFIMLYFNMPTLAFILTLSIITTSIFVTAGYYQNKKIFS